MFKVDFHVHSELSHDSKQSLAEIAGSAKLAGLDAVCVCDHNASALDKITEIDGITLLPGCEISSAHEHIVALLCDTPVDVKALQQNGLPDAASVIDEIHKCGGIAVIAHPFGHTQKSEWKGDGLKFDAVEVINARAWMKNAKANDEAMTFASSLQAVCLAGSDAHIENEIGNAYTIVDCESISEIKDAVLKHKTDAVLKQNARRICKGKSQMIRGQKDGSLKRRVLAFCVLCKCILLDIFGK